MTQFTLGVADILRATGWGIFRVRALLNKPHHLTYVKRFGPKGGNAARLFRLSDILVRCRMKQAFTEKIALNLIAADAACRKENS